MAREIRPIQLALHLPGADEELDNALGYNLDAWHSCFVSGVVRGLNGADAVREADEFTGRKPRSAAACATKAHKLLTHQAGSSNAVALAIQHRRKRLAATAEWTDREWWATLRHTRDVALGEAPIRKTLVRVVDGKTTLEHEYVYDPSLTAATKTLELAGRTLKLLGAEGATIEPGADGAVTVRFLGVRPGDDNEGEEEGATDAGVPL